MFAFYCIMEGSSQLSVTVCVCVCACVCVCVEGKEGRKGVHESACVVCEGEDDGLLKSSHQP